MDCRKSYEIDLAAFLAGSADPTLEEFRAHCRGCADCSAEVRAWSELDSRLRAAGAEADGAHPAEEALLAFEERSSSLDSERRRSIEQHLASCAPCRDELAALRSFDFSALREPARGRVWTSGGALARTVAGVRALVLHPAFAYALVFLLLVPTLVEHSSVPLAPRPRPVDARKPAAVQAPIEALADRRKEKTNLGPPKEETEHREPQARQPHAEQRAPEGFARERQLETGGGALGIARAPAPAAAPPESVGIVGAEKDAALGAESRMREPKWRSTSAGTALDLGTQYPPEIALPPPDSSLLLSVPLPTTDASAVELVLVSPDGRRQLRERAPRSESGRAEISVPGAWFESGQHRVEVYLSDRRATPASSFPFVVRAPLGDRRPPASALHGSALSQ